MELTINLPDRTPAAPIAASGAPWTLVTFYDKDLARTVNVEWLVVVVVLLVSYTSVYVAICLAVLFVRPKVPRAVALAGSDSVARLSCCDPANADPCGHVCAVNRAPVTRRPDRRRRAAAAVRMGPHLSPDGTVQRASGYATGVGDRGVRAGAAAAGFGSQRDSRVARCTRRGARQRGRMGDWRDQSAIGQQGVAAGAAGQHLVRARRRTVAADHRRNACGGVLQSRLRHSA